ncbi:LicD family protein [Selenomonas sp. WCA-380-WT-3B 3/]|uniref:LicD family protein n=1 Tax=Selenomonas montiformis TaxID=2652285 RepID=A0A6I2V2R3_9FIRM|nr:LicD family protein [Selenomonas montiformis]MSV25946.1 LicD family protein [Selenomonas montiformis]
MNDEKELLLQMQKKQLEMLHELDRVCRKNNLRYALSSGTCLGAVRHGGFIPWDDDIDVYMSWQDAEKLVRCQSDFQDKYFVQSYKTDPEFTSIHYRLCDSTTSCFLEETRGKDINHGIFLDIYIYYPYPDNKLKAHKVILDSFIYRVLVSNSGPKNHGGIAKFLGDVVFKFYKGKRREKKIIEIENEFKYNGGEKYVATYFGRDATLINSIIYPIEWFTSPKYLKFEDMEVPCPGNPEQYCILQYGENYMELPPKEKRKPHHDFIYFSTNEPYKKFKGIYY